MTVKPLLVCVLTPRTYEEGGNFPALLQLRDVAPTPTMDEHSDSAVKDDLLGKLVEFMESAEFDPRLAEDWAGTKPSRRKPICQENFAKGVENFRNASYVMVANTQMGKTLSFLFLMFKAGLMRGMPSILLTKNNTSELNRMKGNIEKFNKIVKASWKAVKKAHRKPHPQATDMRIPDDVRVRATVFLCLLQSAQSSVASPPTLSTAKLRGICDDANCCHHKVNSCISWVHSGHESSHVSQSRCSAAALLCACCVREFRKSWRSWNRYSVCVHMKNSRRLSTFDSALANAASRQFFDEFRQGRPCLTHDVSDPPLSVFFRLCSAACGRIEPFSGFRANMSRNAGFARVSSSMLRGFSSCFFFCPVHRCLSWRRRLMRPSSLSSSLLSRTRRTTASTSSRCLFL